MAPVGHIRNDPHNTKYMPHQHHRHGLLREVETTAAIKSPFDPDISEQAIHDAGHPSKMRVTIPSTSKQLAVEPELCGI